MIRVSVSGVCKSQPLVISYSILSRRSPTSAITFGLGDALVSYLRPFCVTYTGWLFEPLQPLLKLKEAPSFCLGHFFGQSFWRMFYLT
jgi:hypothetical protein